MSGKWVRERRGAAASASASEASSESVEGARRLVRPLGQGDALARWVRAARQLQLPHGLVVEGTRGVGKTVVVQWLTAALLCPSELDQDEPCAVCRTCTRIANDQHPDVHLIQRARDEDERKGNKASFYVLTVEQVREAETQLRRHAVEGRARVCVIAEADRLAEEGQNALLKTLEEPGTATFLVLEASRPEQLLPTVRSRVQRLRVVPLADEVLRDEMARRFPGQEDRLDGLVRRAHGSLGAALEATTERAVQLHDLVRAWFAGTQNLRPVATARAALEGVTERRLEVERAREFLALLRAELRRHRDALASGADGSYVAASLEPWTTWLEQTLHAERDLDLLIPPEQVLTACLAQLLA